MLSTVAYKKSAHARYPAMNTAMFENCATQENMEKLKQPGRFVLLNRKRSLACGDSGRGKLPDRPVVVARLCGPLVFQKIFAGKRILVTRRRYSGGHWTPVRYMRTTPPAKWAMKLQRPHICAVQLPGFSETALSVPPGIEFVQVISAEEMYRACTELASSCGVIIKPRRWPTTARRTAEQKMKKGGGADNSPDSK